MTPTAEYIDIDSTLDGGENRTDVDELAQAILDDGKINADDAQAITKLKDFFESDKRDQLDDTKSALSEVFSDMLKRGYSVGEDIDNLKNILHILGANVDLQTLLDTEETIKDGREFSLKLEDDGKYYVNAEELGDQGDIIRLGYFDENGTYVQKVEDWYSTTDNQSDNNTISRHIQKPTGGVVSVDELIGDAIAKDLSERKDALLDEKDAIIAQRDTTIETQRGTIEGLTREIDGYKGQLESLEAAKAVLEKQAEADSETIKGLNATIAELKGTIGELEAAKLALEAQGEKDRAKIAKLGERLVSINAQKEALQLAVAAAGIENTRISELLTQAEAKIAELEAQAVTDTRSAKVREAELEAANGMVRELEGEVASLNNRIGDLEREKGELEKTLNELKASGIASEEDIKDLNDQIRELADQLLGARSLSEGQERTINELKASLSQAEEALEAAQNQLLQTQEAELKDEYEELLKDVDEGSGSITELQSRLEGLMMKAGSINILQAELQTLEAKIVSLSQRVDLKDTRIKLDARASGAALGELSGAESPTRDMIIGILESYLEKFPVWNSAEQKAFWSSTEGYQTAYALQVGLVAIGENPGTIDGVWGRRSSAALSKLGHGKVPGPNSITELTNRFKAL